MAWRPLWPGDRYGLLAFILYVKFFNNIKISVFISYYGLPTIMAWRLLWPKDRYGLETVMVSWPRLRIHQNFSLQYKDLERYSCYLQCGCKWRERDSKPIAVTGKQEVVIT